MKQYYTCVNLTQKQFLAPHNRNTFTTLMVQGWLGNPRLFAVSYLLAPGQPWHKTKIVWAGDCMDDGVFLPKYALDKKQNLYIFALDHFYGKTLDVYEVIKEMYFAEAVAKILEDCRQDEIFYSLVDIFNKEFRFILNHAKKEFVDKLKCPACSDGWIIHPLSLLTSSGNGRGGGDYRGKSDYVGTWAGDVISVESELPTGFKEIQPNFIE